MKRAAILLFAVAACSKADDKPKSQPAAASAPSPAPPSAPAPTKTDELGLLADLPTIEHVDCAKVLPQSLVDKFFPGAKVTTPIDGVCDIDLGDDSLDVLNVQYDCGLPLTDDDVKSVLAVVTDAKPIADLGRGANQDDVELRAFDRDSACLLTANYTTPPAKLVEFMRAALDAVPAK
jgi:hypothetical protein